MIPKTHVNDHGGHLLVALVVIYVGSDCIWAHIWDIYGEIFFPRLSVFCTSRVKFHLNWAETLAKYSSWMGEPLVKISAPSTGNLTMGTNITRVGIYLAPPCMLIDQQGCRIA